VRPVRALQGTDRGTTNAQAENETINPGAGAPNNKEEPQKMKKRLLSLLLVLVMIVGLLPTIALAAGGDPATQVHVTVENTTFTEASEASNWLAPAWSGKEIDTWITLTDDLTMMDCVRMAIEEIGWTQNGAESGYIREINGVGEFDNGGDSGWMGTLNDWFTNYGFDHYTVADGTLKPGDEIRVMYTSTGRGADLGADWSGSDKRVKSLEFPFQIKVNNLSKYATLVPAFSPDQHEYDLILSTEFDVLDKFCIVPTAMNKQYQVHTYVDGVEFRRTEEVSIKPGSVITVKSGDPSWETANPNTAPAEEYTIRVIHPTAHLTVDDLHITTYKQDPVADPSEPKVLFDPKFNTFKVTLNTYTENPSFNDAGFQVSLKVPEGSSAVLLDEYGVQLGDFSDGPITQENCLIYSGKTYLIALTTDETTEYYPLQFNKGKPMSISSLTFTCKPGAPETINGYPEGTMFALDADGNPTGKIGLQEESNNYLVYISEKTQSVKIAAKGAGVAQVAVYMNGTKTGTKPTVNMAMMQLVNNKTIDVSSGSGSLVLEASMKAKPYVNMSYTFTFRRFRVSPEELMEQIEALPNAETASYATELYRTVCGILDIFNGYSDEEKAQVTNSEKLLAVKARLDELKVPYEEKIDALTGLVSSYAGKVTEENYKQYLDDVRKAEIDYLALSDAQRADFMRTNVAASYWPDYYTATLAAIKNGDSIGYPTQYPDDFMLHNSYYNLDLGQEVETGFREIWTNRPEGYQSGEKGLPFTSPGLLEFDIKDDSIFEIREKQDVYVDKGLGGTGEHPNMRYYLVPKKAGTTTFTVKLCDDKGVMYCQTPEIVVHVNDPKETEIGELHTKLTNFESLENTSKYADWGYEYGTDGAEFSFHVNGDNGKVYVYNYLEYNADGTPVKTTYTADGNGDVTVLLKDGYNCIEVNADYEGQNVTQVYALKGKVVKFVVENETRPGENLRIGDTAGVWTIGKNIPVHKILRIYNNGTGKICYITDMPRQGYLTIDADVRLTYPGFTSASEAGSYARLKVPLTASGTIVLRDGYQSQGGYGSGLGSEFTQGNTGGMAASTGMEIGHLADITLHVEDDPNYTLPEAEMSAVASNSGVVKAGESITISVPDLPVDALRSKYEINAQNKLNRATLAFYTQIPGVKKISTRYLSSGAFTDDEGTSVSTLEEIKNITFTVPASTPAGTYKIHGGYVDLLVTVGFLDSYPTEYRGMIDDVTITVLPGAQKEVMDLIDAIGPVTTSSGTAITAARNAYDALTDEQKALVTNYQTLLDAEERYAELTKPITPVVPSTPSKPSQNENAGKDNLPFTDVASGSWYYDGVKYVCDNGLMNGTSANEFNPNANTTRSMIVTILARMEGVNTSGGATWYAAGREWAMGAGISDGTNMTGKITREQLAAMLYRYAKLKGYDVSASADISGYTDASSVSSWATDAMRWAVSAGLINGRTATTLAPQGNATRAEVASILMRFMQKYTK